MQGEWWLAPIAGVAQTAATNLLMQPLTADTLAARINELVAKRTDVDGWS